MRSQQRPQEQQEHQQQRPQAGSQQDTAMSESLADLLVLLPPLLSATSADDDDGTNSLDQESLELLLSSPPLSELESLLPELAALTSASLHSSALSLARVLHPTTNPSYLHRHIPSLPTALAALHDASKAAHEELSAARLRASEALLALLDAYSTALALLLRTLENKHGPVARSLDLRATDMSLRARRLDVDVRAAAAELHAGVYPSEAVAALANYAAHLRDARMRVEEGIKVRTAELAEYGVGVEGGAQKERMMREMARVHRDMTRQLEDAKRDLERLEKN
jgi:hypothetical protein